MQKYRVETIYENNMKDFVLLCNVLLHGQTIHGLGPEDIVQRVMLQAWEKKEKLKYHENLMVGLSSPVPRNARLFIAVPTRSIATSAMRLN